MRHSPEQPTTLPNQMYEFSSYRRPGVSKGVRVHRLKRTRDGTQSVQAMGKPSPTRGWGADFPMWLLWVQLMLLSVTS